MLGKALTLGAAGAAGESDPNFNQTVLLLHGDGTNGAQNNTFLDGSTNNFTITRNGNTTQGTFSPFSVGAGEWSNYFDGTGDYLSISDSTAFNMGSGNFTVECWIYTTNASATSAFLTTAETTDYQGFFLGMASSQFYFLADEGSDPWAVSIVGGTVVANTWTHVAGVRNGNVFTLYVNGSSVGTSTQSITLGNSNNRIVVGGRTASGGQYFSGYIANARVVKGTAVYTSGFTPSTTPLTAITNTQLLTCQSNRFVDNSTNAFAITRNGDVRVTPFSPFAPTAAYSASTNGGSGYFDGSGDYLAAGAASDWTFLSNTTALFSVEIWVYYQASGSSESLFGTNNNSSTSIGVMLQKTSSEKIFFEITRGVSGSRVVDFTSTGSVIPGSWNHLLLTYDQSLASGNLKLYINGGAAETGNKTANAPSSSDPATALRIGSATGSTNLVNGFIGGMRISNVIRSNVVPTGPYTSDANTELLLNYTNAGIFDNTGKNNLETVGNAQIDTGTKKFGTGSLEFDGTGDYLLMPINQNLILNSDFTIEGWLYLTSGTTYYTLLATSAWGANNGGMLVLQSHPSYTGKLSLWLANNASGASPLLVGATSLSATTWTHFAICRSGNSFKMYINGVEDDSDTSSAAISLAITQIGALSGSDAYNGFIDDLRITKGIARYTGTFTPPAKAFPDL